MAGQCGATFYVTGSVLSYICTSSNGHLGAHEWDSRKDPSHVDYQGR